jgi:hypothetical protein
MSTFPVWLHEPGFAAENGSMFALSAVACLL